ncbi:unnamed protein product [Rhodiola kirilowii]
MCKGIADELRADWKITNECLMHIPELKYLEDLVLEVVN